MKKPDNDDENSGGISTTRNLESLKRVSRGDHMYLNAVDYATIANVERMHDEDKDDGLENSLAGVVEHDSHENHLCHDEEYEFGRRQPHHQQGYHDYDHANDRARQLVELLHRRFRVIQRVR